MHSLQPLIESAFEQRQSLTPTTTPPDLKNAIQEIIQALDNGSLRIAEKQKEEWIVHEWLKKAVLLYFRTHNNVMVDAGHARYFDKVPLKYAATTHAQFEAQSTRIVPPATIRIGAYIGKNTVIMPSYVNIGAYVDDGTLIDTWATVGSCAQIGKNVHISGGTGIGGVLEPLQAKPTIIEDNCFIGARSEIVEGVIIGAGSVISMGVYIGQSTRIYDRENDTVHYGYVPPGSVVVSGSLPSHNGKYGLYCAVIVKKVDEKTRAKVSINELLRTAE
jgi:2,3,4,5-tetrahydropyridine-2,6-dicarboxylate N-succinyltransferase